VINKQLFVLGIWFLMSHTPLFADLKNINDKRISELENVNVRVIFIRHGFSCGNVLEASHKTAASYPDPELTSLGVDLSKANGEKLKEELAKRNIVVDFIGSSSLIRAIETAYYLFGDEKNIYPLPFVAEKYNTLDNTPLPPKQQRNVISNDDCIPCLDENTCPIKFKPFYDAQVRGKSNIEEFNNWLADNLDNILSKSKQWHPINDGIFTMAIVTHRNFIYRELGFKDVPNNSVFENILLFKREEGKWQFIGDKHDKYQKIDYEISLPEEAPNYNVIVKTLGQDRCRIDVRTKSCP